MAPMTGRQRRRAARTARLLASRALAASVVLALATTASGCGYLAVVTAGAIAGTQSSGGSTRYIVISTAADLVLARGPFDTGDTREGKGVTDLVAAQFRFNATNVLTLHSVTLTASGSGDDRTLANVRLVEDLDSDGVLDAGEPNLATPGAFAADDGKLTFAGIERAFALGESVDVLLVLDTPAGAADGDTFQLEIASAQDVSATTDVSGSVEQVPIGAAPLRSGLKEISQTGSLNAFVGAPSPVSRTVFANATDEPVVQIDFRASSAEQIRIDRLVLTAGGTGDDTLVVADLYHDVDSDGALNLAIDQPLALGVTAGADNGTLSFTSLAQTLAPGEVVRWLVVYAFAAAPRDGDTFALDLAAASDVTAQGLTSAQPIVPTGPPWSARP